MEKWFKFCEEKTATISVSGSASCDAVSLRLIDINIDARKMKPCVKGTDSHSYELVKDKTLTKKDLT